MSMCKIKINYEYLRMKKYRERRINQLDNVIVYDRYSIDFQVTLFYYCFESYRTGMKTILFNQLKYKAFISAISVM